MIPSFIPRELFRAYLKSGALNKLAKIDGVLVSSYLARCERDGKPIPSKIRQGSRHYRMLDIVAKARANNLTIEPPLDVQLIHDIAYLQTEKRNLIAEIANKKHQLALYTASSKLTGATLLTEEEIASV